MIVFSVQIYSVVFITKFRRESAFLKGSHVFDVFAETEQLDFLIRNISYLYDT